MKKFLALPALLLMPAVAFAQNGDLGNVTDIVQSIGNIIDILLPIVFAIALLFFFWGLAKFILAAGDEDAKDEGKRIMIWGIVALFIMASVFGIIAFIQDAVGVDNNSNVTIPSVEVRN